MSPKTAAREGLTRVRRANIEAATEIMRRLIYRASATDARGYRPGVDRGMKTCPECAEQVQDAARVCRFCRYRFDDSSVERAQPTPPPTAGEAEAVPTEPSTRGKSVRRPAAWFALLPTALVVAATIQQQSDPTTSGEGAGSGFWETGAVVVVGGAVSWVFFFALTAGFLWLVHAAEAVPLPAPARRVPIPQDLRWMVFARDGYRCLECGSPVDLTIDHIQPVSWGGSNDPSNLQTLCRGCNSVKGDRW